MKTIKTAGSKAVKQANGNQVVSLTKIDWEKIGLEAGWIKSEAKKKSPKQHGFIEQCMDENKDKDSPGGYCASIVDKVKGTTDWRKGPKKDK
jgi:hypothetical protein